MFEAIASILQTGYGIYQSVDASNKLANLQRPEYETPGEINQIKSLARTAYGDPSFAGQQAAQDRLDQQAATAYQQSSVAGNPFAAIAGIQAGQQAGQQNLNTFAAQQQQQDLMSYQRALQTAAPYTETEFQLNELAPYLDQFQESRDQFGAGTKNIYGGTRSLGSVADALTTSSMSNKSSQTGDTSSVFKKYNPTNNNSSSTRELTPEEKYKFFNLTY